MTGGMCIHDDNDGCGSGCGGRGRLVIVVSFFPIENVFLFFKKILQVVIHLPCLALRGTAP